MWPSRVSRASGTAPSSGNLQNWRFIVIREPANRKRIADACTDQGWVTDVPILIAVLADPDQADKMYGPQGRQLYSIQNCAAAIENMLIAATALDLGSCWIGSFEEHKIRSALQLPEHVILQALIAIGYAAESPLLPQKKRIEWITTLERWAGRRKTPMRGYLSEVWPKIIEGAKEQIQKKIKKLK